MLATLKRQWVVHIKAHTTIYLIILFVFISGIMAGAFTVLSLPPQQRLNTGNFLQEFFKSGQNLSINRWIIFKSALWQHLITILLVWFFSLFIWGSPFILVIIGIKGFSFGFTVGFMVEYYGFGGFLFSLLCILPQSLIYVPCYLGIGILSLLFSTLSLGGKNAYYSKHQRQNMIGSHTGKFLIAFLSLLVGIMIETFISPLFFPLFLWIFG
ncbi:MAG: stage II sporulation protein M [Clostridiales bacterium]|nr:stage II sporulation protein M [Clostridiales bacterium]